MDHTSKIHRSGHVHIHISEDVMKAEIDLFPPASGGSGYTVKSIVADLKNAGVNWGIDNDQLESAVLKSLTDGVVMRGVPVARGEKMKKSVSAYWHLKERLINPPLVDLKSASVDYRDRTPFVLVKKGEPLAEMVPEFPGSPGHNVSGALLAVIPKGIVALEPGENIVEKNNVLYAACPGRFEIRDRKMTINEVLDIPGNVDYSTGHVAFPGDVIIHGSVCDGFRVAAGKSIFVKQTMDASQVIARGKLVVQGGIKGRGAAEIKADAGVVAKFIENVTIETSGDIIVEKAVMHSQIHTLGILSLGETGVLVGGEVWAQNGVLVGNIGRPESPAANIRIGSDYIADRKLQHIRARIQGLEAKLDKIKNRPGSNAEQQSLVHQAEAALEKMRDTERSLMDAHHPNFKAHVAVAGKVDTGTTIRIAGPSIQLNSPMKKVVFYHDPEGPRIGTRAFGANDKVPIFEEDSSQDVEPASEENNKNPEAGGSDSEE